MDFWKASGLSIRRVPQLPLVLEAFAHPASHLVWFSILCDFFALFCWGSTYRTMLQRPTFPSIGTRKAEYFRAHAFIYLGFNLLVSLGHRLSCILLLLERIVYGCSVDGDVTGGDPSCDSLCSAPPSPPPAPSSCCCSLAATA